MLTKHSDDEEAEEHIEETFLEDDTEETEEIQDKRRVLRNEAWQYFDISNEDLKMATCKLCNEEFSYRTTSTNLARHLKRKHCMVFQNDNKDDDGNQDEEDKNIKCRPKTSVSWEYFTIKDPEKRLATCKLCGSHFSYLTSVSNLMKHVRTQHGLDSKTSNSDDEEETMNYESDEKITELQTPETERYRSSVWLYFKCIDKVSRISVCLICKKRLSHLTSITNLKRHLYRKHPHISLNQQNDSKKMLISSDGQLYEIEEGMKQEHLTINDDDDEQNAEPMEIYLDEVEGNVIENKKITPKTKRKSLQKRKIVIDDNNDIISSDDEITFRKRYIRRYNDSLDQFGKYLVSLLRQLPKEVSNQLQADFVKQAVTAQTPPKVIVTRPSNGYAITITDSRPNDSAVATADNDVFVAVEDGLDENHAQ